MGYNNTNNYGSSSIIDPTEQLKQDYYDKTGQINPDAIYNTGSQTSSSNGLGKYGSALTGLLSSGLGAAYQMNEPKVTPYVRANWKGSGLADIGLNTLDLSKNRRGSGADVSNLLNQMLGRSGSVLSGVFSGGSNSLGSLSPISQAINQYIQSGCTGDNSSLISSSINDYINGTGNDYGTIGNYVNNYLGY